jgi:hypothetical protein
MVSGKTSFDFLGSLAHTRVHLNSIRLLSPSFIVRYNVVPYSHGNLVYGSQERITLEVEVRNLLSDGHRYGKRKPDANQSGFAHFTSG